MVCEVLDVALEYSLFVLRVITDTYARAEKKKKKATDKKKNIRKTHLGRECLSPAHNFIVRLLRIRGENNMLS